MNLPSVIPLPADEVLLGTTRVSALRSAGYLLDVADGRPVIYPRDATHPTRYCVLRRETVSETADTIRPPPPPLAPEGTPNEGQPGPYRD